MEQLLAQYEQAGGGRLKVLKSASANTARADGITSFNIDKGDACYFGIAVVCGGQREALPRLAPEWEQALESDLSRAIARAVEAQVAAAPPAPKVDTAALDTVKTMIPDTSAVSVEDGSQALRDAARVRFIQAGEELKAQVDAAEQRFIQAQASQSEEAQKAAAEDLRKIQADGTRKLQQIAYDSQAQVTALEQLKKAAP